MLLEGESQFPDSSRDLWVCSWESRYNQNPVVPDHIVKRIEIEKHFLQTATTSPSEIDTYRNSLARTAKAHIIYMSKEWYLAEHININVRQTPRIYETVTLGSGLNREDVREIMEERDYQEYENIVMQQVARREGKIASRRGMSSKQAF